MIPVAYIFRQLLLDLNLGEVSGAWSTFVSLFPAAPDDAIVIYDTTGALQGRIMRTGEQVEKPGIQIRVRSLIYPTAFEKAWDIAKALDSIYQQQVVTTNPAATFIIHSFSRNGGILPMGMEEGDRPRFHFTVNGIVTLRQIV